MWSSVMRFIRRSDLFFYLVGIVIYNFLKGGGGWNEFIKGGGLLNVWFFEFNEKISDDLNFFCKYL